MKMSLGSIWRWILMAAATVSVAHSGSGGLNYNEAEAEITPYRFDLSSLQLGGSDVIGGGGGAEAKRKVMVNTATNSPIYYIDRSHFLFPSFLLRPRPPPSPPKKKRRRPTTSTTPAPLPPASTLRPSTIQMLPLPFVSNAKPVGYYHWTPPTITTTTLAPPSTTTLAPPSTTTLATPPPLLSSTTPPSPSRTVTNSRVIRLKTRFLANGRPSALYLHNSPHRRYSLKDLIRHPPSSAHAHNKPHAKRKPLYNRKPLYDSRKPSYNNNRKWWN